MVFFRFIVIHSYPFISIPLWESWTATAFFSILDFMVRFSSKQMVWYRGTGRTSCWARSQLSCRLGLWKADVECFTMFYPLKIVIFHSYLSLPEGTIKKIAIYSCFEPEMLQKQLSFTMFDPIFLWYTRRWMTSVVSKKKGHQKNIQVFFFMIIKPPEIASWRLDCPVSKLLPPTVAMAVAAAMLAKTILGTTWSNGKVPIARYQDLVIMKIIVYYGYTIQSTYRFLLKKNLWVICS